MFKPSAEVLNYVITPTGEKLISFKLTMHRWVLSEFNTHRSFSRNSASSRAVPIEKMIQLAETANVCPVEWGKNCPGMSNKEIISEQSILASVQNEWELARHNAIESARRLNNLNVHKQIVNRILEPFLPHVVIATMDTKSLEHFLFLRNNANAQPEIRALAIEIENEYRKSIPKKLKPFSIYSPFGIHNWKNLNLVAVPYEEAGVYENKFMYSQPIYRDVARCARISYLKHEESEDESKDEALFWKLFKNKHLSPFEHLALYDPDKNFSRYYGYFEDHDLYKSNFPDCFIQLRKLVELNL
jgi:thymidylate synthase ThyX